MVSPGHKELMIENVSILIAISQKFFFNFMEVPKGTTDNNSSLLQVMDWCQTGTKPLHEPVMTQFIDAFKHHHASVSFNSCCTELNFVRMIYISLTSLTLSLFLNK